MWLGLGLSGPALGLVESVAFAVHSEDMNVVVSRSSRAPVNRSEPNPDVHSSNGRLLVTIVLPRS